MIAAGGGPGSVTDFLIALAFMWGPLLVGAGVPFAALFGSVKLARSSAMLARGAGILLAVAFVAATLFVTLNPVLGSCMFLAIGQGLVLLVGAAGLALVIVVGARRDGTLNHGLARWSLPIIILSLGLGGLGLVGFGALNLPLQQMGEVQGVGPENFQTVQMLTVLRNQAPIAVSMAAAAVGAIAWRVTGRQLGVWATLLGCAGVGANLMLLFLHTGD